MEEFLKHLITSICDKPDEVSISRSENDFSIEFTIRVAEDEYGKLIGRGGKTINALKTLLNLYAFKHDTADKKRIHLRVENDSREQMPHITQTDSPSLEV